MKTKLLLLTFAAFIAACSNQDQLDADSAISNSQENKDAFRNYEEALLIAEASINMFDNNSVPTRNHNKSRKIKRSERKAYTNDIKTRAISADKDTLIYIFNFENNEGFALVSASKNTEALLAITDKGYCNPEEKSKIEGFDDFIQMAKIYVLNATKTPILRIYDDPIVETKDSITYAYQEVGPYISVNWGQTLPEGEFCPNGVAGCGNTALAQIMSYYNYPTSISITFPGAGVTTQSLNWTAMKAHSTGHPRNSCSDQTTHDAIGRLLRQLGTLNNSVYDMTDSLTSTQTSNLSSTINTLGYSQGNWRSYKSIVARNSLDDSELFYMVGTGSGGGHAWVLDGYRTVIATIRHMGRTATSGWFIIDVTTETNYYLHFNWGWYGDCNGYFLEGIYNTTQAYLYDNSTNVHNYNFSSGVEMKCIYH